MELQFYKEELSLLTHLSVWTYGYSSTYSRFGHWDSFTLALVYLGRIPAHFLLLSYFQLPQDAPGSSCIFPVPN